MRETGEIVSAESRSVWRAWLSAHCQSESEAWLVFPVKGSDLPGVTYNDAVEEALCFGWIDSTLHPLDEKRHLRRFTPRRPGSPYSRPNIERLLRMDREGKLLPAVRAQVLPIITAPYTVPEDILAAIMADEAAWANYRAFPPAYQRIRTAYIDAARHRPEEFDRRLSSFLKKTREGKRISGYGGIDAYYDDCP